MKKVIGLMGNSGSGKSTVARYLAAKGALVIDADEVSHGLCEPGQPGCAQIKERFGAYFFNDDDTLNRRRLGRHVFADKRELRKLEDILHPLILREVKHRLDTATDGLVVIDAALLVQTGLLHMVDEVWLVKADIDTKVNRICSRDGIPHEQAINRLRNQQTDEQQMQYAHHILVNNGSEQELIEQVEAHLGA